MTDTFLPNGPVPPPAPAPAPTPTTAPPPAASRTTATGPSALPSAFPTHALSLATLAIHADDHINTHRAVAPPLHVSSTFRYAADPAALAPGANADPAAPFDSHVYARDSAPNTTRLEAVLASLLEAPVLSYASGLAAFHALLVHLNPRRVAIGEGYHGCVGVVRLLGRLTGVRMVGLGEGDLASLERGDVLHVETPVNPSGEARDLAYFAGVARERGCYLTVDATFAPPPLMRPFELGADVVLHSGTKYFGGHSDMLCGVLAVAPGRAAEGMLRGLREDRMFLGSVMGSLEGWLGVRSLRTLELRVERQSKSAECLVTWLDGEVKRKGSAVGRVVERVQHASLQPEAREEGSWLRKQMPRGYGPVFAVWMRQSEGARRLPSKLCLFHHATSLGGVESLIEWRAMTDKSVDKRVLRVSIGVEAWEDLKADLEMGFAALIAEGLGQDTASESKQEVSDEAKHEVHDSSTRNGISLESENAKATPEIPPETSATSLPGVLAEAVPSTKGEEAVDPPPGVSNTAVETPNGKS